MAGRAEIALGELGATEIAWAAPTSGVVESTWVSTATGLLLAPVLAFAAAGVAIAGAGDLSSLVASSLSLSEFNAAGASLADFDSSGSSLSFTSTGSAATAFVGGNDSQSILATGGNGAGNFIFSSYSGADANATATASFAAYALQTVPAQATASASAGAALNLAATTSGNWQGLGASTISIVGRHVLQTILDGTASAVDDWQAAQLIPATMAATGLGGNAWGATKLTNGALTAASSGVLNGILTARANGAMGITGAALANWTLAFTESEIRRVVATALRPDEIRDVVRLFELRVVQRRAELRDVPRKYEE